MFLRLQVVHCMLLLVHSNGRTNRLLYAGLDDARKPKRKRKTTACPRKLVPPRGAALKSGPKVFGPVVFGPQVFGPKVFGPKVSGPTVSSPKVFGPKVFGPQVFGPKMFGSKVFGPKSFRP